MKLLQLSWLVCVEPPKDSVLRAGPPHMSVSPTL